MQAPAICTVATRKTKQPDDAQAQHMAARALVDIPTHGVAAGGLIETDAETMAGLMAAGVVDQHPDAVAYAKAQAAAS